MKPILDLTGKRFMRLTVLKQSGTIRNHAAWLCLCDCGNTKLIQGSSLKNGNSKSCGCLRVDTTRKRSITHGQSKTRTWQLWQAMIDRCRYPSGIQYKDYGGRGITVCKRWSKYEAFIADLGQCPEGMSLERINNSKGYSPKNCKWATRLEQANNKRNNQRISYKGHNLTIAQWSRETGIAYHTIYQRLLRYDWPIEKALQH